MRGWLQGREMAGRRRLLGGCYELPARLEAPIAFSADVNRFWQQ